MSDQRNLIVAIALSILILIAYQYLFELPRQREAQEKARLEQAEKEKQNKDGVTTPSPGAKKAQTTQELLRQLNPTAARADAIKIGEIDRGGAINTISPDGIISENCVGQATSGYLVQIERLSGEEMESWRRKYPEAFARKYEPAGGLRFDAWVIKKES